MKTSLKKFDSAIFLLLISFSILDGLGQVQYGWMGDPGPRPFSQPDRFPTCIAYGNGIFVSAGYDRLILMSRDGTNWVNRSSSVTNTVIGINYNFEIYTSGGDSLTFVLPDDPSSKLVVQRKSFQFRAVAFGNNTFVILGESGEILLSQDGENWCPVNAPASVNFSGIVWGGDKFVAVGDAGTILTSPDGIKWMSRNSDTDKDLSAVAFGRGVFTAWGNDHDYNVVLTSKDGVTWIPNANNYSRPIGNVAYGNGIFVAVGKDTLTTSSDGIHWNPAKMPPQKMVGGTIMGQNVFIPFPFFSSSRLVSSSPSTMHSQDGQTWQTFAGKSFSGNVIGNDTRFDNNKRSDNDETRAKFAVLTSEDGITWTRLLPISLTTPNPIASAVAATNTATPIPSSIAIVFNLNGQSYKLNLSAKVGEIYELQASTDLEQWVNLAAMTNNGEALNFIDQDTAKYPQRFYRLMELQQ